MTCGASSGTSGESERPASRSTALVWLATVALLLLSAALYLPSVANPLVWDDTIHSSAVADGGLAAAFERSHGQYRRPLVLLSYMLQQRLGLGSAGALHAANAVLHGANATLLFLLLLGVGLSMTVALGAAVVFTVHPVQSGAVAYVSGRTDLLAGLFLLLVLHTVLAGKRVGWAVAALCALAAACSKETGLLAGPLSLALWWTTRGRERIMSPAAAGAAMAASLLVAPFVLPPALAQAGSLDIVSRLQAAGTALGTYAGLLVRPVHLHLDRLTPLVSGPWTLAAGLLLAAALLLAALLFVLRPTVAHLGWLAAALLYLPASGLLPVYPAIARHWIFTPEHFLYLPLAVLSPIGAVAFQRLLKATLRPWPLKALWLGEAGVLAAAILLAALWVHPVLARQRQFADAETLYRQTLRYSPSPRACFNLGVTLLERTRYREAASVYERCARLSPSDASVYVQLGVAWQKAGERLRAEMAYKTALDMNPGDALAWSNYASLQASAGDYEQAREKWSKALAIDPELGPARRGLAKLGKLVQGEAAKNGLR